MKHLESKILALNGPGRISDDVPINLTEYVLPIDIAYQEKVVCRKHYQRRFSMKIGGTVFDVITHFNAEGRQTVLQQFRDLILSEHFV